MDRNKYGLIKLTSKTNKTLNTLKPSVFNDSDSDEPTNESAAKTTFYSAKESKRQTQLDRKRAIIDDPNVFEYDSIYDEMKSKKETTVEKESKERKPKYINNLLKHADHRKREQERRVERQIQKERHEEGDMFADKEAFVTTAYKEKLEEMRIDEEKDQRLKAIEDVMEVTKQKDLTGFYRHLLNRTISGETDQKPSNNSETTDDSLKDINSSSQNLTFKSTNKRNRQFRKRHSSEKSTSSLEETNETTNNEMTNATNSSIIANKEETVSDSLDPKDKVKDSLQNKSIKMKINISDEQFSKSDDTIEKSLNYEETSNTISVAPTVQKLDKQAIIKQLFTKRTVGEVFDAARTRYLQRKNSKILV